MDTEPLNEVNQRLDALIKKATSHPEIYPEPIKNWINMQKEHQP